MRKVKLHSEKGWFDINGSNRVLDSDGNPLTTFGIECCYTTKTGNKIIEFKHRDGSLGYRKATEFDIVALDQIYKFPPEEEL